MNSVDEQASEFVIQHSYSLRQLPYSDLYTENSTQEGEVIEIQAPTDLSPYEFSFSRCNYDKGIIRVHTLGYKSGAFINTSFKDAFDIYPDGRIREIDRNDEDWCGRT